MAAQALVFLVLAAALVLFIWERWRYDVVALFALLTLTLAGVIPAAEAFAGFGHPAVITVAAVLVIGLGIANSGIVDTAATLISRVGSRPTLQVMTLTGVVAVCSAFMNNVGALALMMPVALRMARRHDISPSVLLMPLAFGSLLGGMTTLIGTPPNIILSTYRVETRGEPFRMFDYAPVGLTVAVVGLAFIGLAGWRLIPRREGQATREAMFRIKDYTIELRLPEGSRFAGKTLPALMAESETDFVVVAISRGERRLLAPSHATVLREGDAILAEVDPARLADLLKATDLELAAKNLDETAMKSDEITLVEAVVQPHSMLAHKTAVELRLRDRHGINLLAVSRQGSRLEERLKDIRFRPGDVLLIQGNASSLPNVLSTLGCLPLAERELKLPPKRRLAQALLIFGGALAALVSGLVPAETAFVTAAVVMVVTGLVTLSDAYKSIEWPIIVLLAAMIPVGGALESTGGAATIANKVALLAGSVPIAVTLGAMILITMCLSDVMNNAATAVVMAPIAISIAKGLEVSADPFLMAVAIGASCAFLTPIGHQSNTLVMGPGGYRFSDYWRLGLPLELMILLLAVPMLLVFWPP